MWVKDFMTEREGTLWLPEHTQEVMRQIAEIEKTVLAISNAPPIRLSLNVTASDWRGVEAAMREVGE